jgi:anti-sigma factor RsiW
MTPQEFQRLKDKAREDRLTADERAAFRAYLLAHPQAQADWDEEQDLDRLINQLPDVPVSSNFTARVLAAAQRETSQRKASAATGSPAITTNAGAWWRWFLRPQAAFVATALIAVGLLAYRQQRALKHAEMAESLAKFADTTALPDVEALKNFEAILRLSQMPVSPDDELLRKLSDGGEQ